MQFLISKYRSFKATTPIEIFGHFHSSSLLYELRMMKVRGGPSLVRIDISNLDLFLTMCYIKCVLILTSFTGKPKTARDLLATLYKKYFCYFFSAIKQVLANVKYCQNISALE